jgi:glycosyltransferase involved in cell wall biosynthesis
MKPLISVIVPVYNAEKTIRRTAASIRAQTYRNLEILLVDDGSSDSTPEILKELSEQDRRIRVIRQENAGAGAARNRGIREASGEYVGFIDADDRIEAEMYDLLYQAAVRHADQKVLIQGGRFEEDENGNRLPDDVATPERETFVPSREFMKTLLLGTGDASFCTKLVPRQFLENARFPEGVLGEDFRLHMDLLPAVEGVVLIPERLYHVVHRSGSATRRADKDSFSKAYVDIVNHADAAEEETASSFPELREAAARVGLYERLEYLLHVPVKDMNRQNDFYTSAVGYLRAHAADIANNPYLTRKNRMYLSLLALMPKKVRQIHRLIKGSRMK